MSSCLRNNSWTCCLVLWTSSTDSLKRFGSNEWFVHELDFASKMKASAPWRISATHSSLPFTVVSDCHSDPVPAISTKWNNNRGYSPGALSSALSLSYSNELFSRGSHESLCPFKPIFKVSFCLCLCDRRLLLVTYVFFFFFRSPALSNSTRWLPSAYHLEWKMRSVYQLSHFNLKKMCFCSLAFNFLFILF